MGAGQKVVYVEDQPDMIRLVGLILESEGMHLIGALGGREGLAKIRQEKPDLVLLDLMMPDIDGWEVYECIKADQQTRRIPVIVITVKASLVERALGLYVYQVDGYVTKPFNAQDLVGTIRRALVAQSQAG